MNMMTYSLVLLFGSIASLFMVVSTTTDTTSCAPRFVEPGKSTGIVDGQRYLVVEIDKPRCWALIRPEGGGASA